jgi:hypothetical protein
MLRQEKFLIFITSIDSIKKKPTGRQENNKE